MGKAVVGVSSAVMHMVQPGKASCSLLAVLSPITPAPMTKIGDVCTDEESMLRRLGGLWPRLESSSV